MKHLLIGLMLLIPWPVPAAPAFEGARTFVISQDFVGNEEQAELCFVSKGGINVRTFDHDCPIPQVFNEEERGLLDRLGARKKLLKGYNVVFTKHMIFVFDPNTRQFVVVNGVTHYGNWQGEKIQLIMVTTSDSADCAPRLILRHELGHAVFMKAGADSSFLDHAPDSTPCDFADNHLLEQVVMVPGVELPAGPIRDKIGKAK